MGVEPTSGVVALTGFEDRERRRTPHPAAGQCRENDDGVDATRGRYGPGIRSSPTALRAGSVADPAAVFEPDRWGEHEPPHEADQKRHDDRNGDLCHGEHDQVPKGVKERTAASAVNGVSGGYGVAVLVSRNSTPRRGRSPFGDGVDVR